MYRIWKKQVEKPLKNKLFWCIINHRQKLKHKKQNKEERFYEAKISKDYFSNACNSNFVCKFSCGN
mgnify:CR=1 FL=1